MNKKMILALACMLVLVFGATPASANYVCTGSVTFLGLNGAGAVWVSLSGGFSYGNPCFVGATNNGWTSDACKALYSQLLVAESTGAPVQFYFNDSTGCTNQTPCCTNQTPWTTLTALYFVAQQK